MICQACGSSNMIEGKFVDGRNYSATFNFAEGSHWSRIIGAGSREVISFACMHCGNLQQQVKFTDQDRARFARFDGPQPSVVADGDCADDEETI